MGRDSRQDSPRRLLAARKLDQTISFVGQDVAKKCSYQRVLRVFVVLKGEHCGGQKIQGFDEGPS